MINQNVGEQKPESVDIKEYLFVLLKRKWLILLCFLLSMAGTTAYLYTRQPIYRATAKLLVTHAGRIIPTADVQRENSGSFYATTASIMRSQVMLRRVQQRMKKTPAEFRENLSDLTITTVRGADIITISVDSPSREFAREFANALADEFLRFRDEQLASTSEQALLAMTREINRLSVELKAANQRMIDFAKENNMPMMERHGGMQETRFYGALSSRAAAEGGVAMAQMRKRILDSATTAAPVIAVLQSDPGTLAAAGPAPVQPGVPYLIDFENQPLIAGGRLRVSVEERPDLNGDYLVSTEGRIELPVVGWIDVMGQKPPQAMQTIKNRLEERLGSTVTVKVAAAPLAPPVQPEVPTMRQAKATNFGQHALVQGNAGLLTSERGEKLFSLENERQELAKRLEEMKKTLKPKHPAVVQVEAHLAQREYEIQITLEFLRQKAAADLQMALDNLTYVRATTAEIDAQVMSSNLRLMELGGLRDEYRRIQSLHETLVGKLMAIDLSQGFNSRNVSVLEPAIVADRPVYPKRTKGMFVAAFGGLGLGLALAFFIEYIDDSIKLAEEVERDLQLSFLGMIPAAQWNPDDLAKHRLDQLKQRGGVAEAYRVVRSAILFSVPRDKLRSMLITSAVPREGKTTTGINLAIGFSQIEDRVLLVDGDLRRGEVHKYFGLPRGKGLADVLLGEAAPEEVLKHTDVPKLDVISTGEYPTNPAELLLGWRLKEFLDWAHKHYNRVIFDGPPVMGIADSAILGSAVDGVLLVIWAGRTSRRYVRVAKMTASSRGAKIIGFILNNLEPGRVGFYHYYPYYYSYYYRGYYTDPNAPSSGQPPTEKPEAMPSPAAQAAQAAAAASGLDVPTDQPEAQKDIEDVY